MPFLDTITIKGDSPGQIFETIFPDDIIGNIANESNQYQSEHSRATQYFTNFTANEIRAMLGVIVDMGLTNLPIQDYWRTSSVIHVPWFRSIFRREKFHEILSYLHLASNKNCSSRDDNSFKLCKLCKLGNISETLNQTLKSCFKPAQTLPTIGKIIGMRSRVSFIQYMPKKPAKFGLKIWALCDSQTGYFLKFQIYKGQENNAPGKGLAERVLMDLMKNYTGKVATSIRQENFFSLFKVMMFIDVIHYVRTVDNFQIP